MILPSAKIEKACSKDQDRPALTHVRFDAEQSQVMACDGYILAVLPVVNDGNGDVSGPITQDAIKLARAGGKSATREIRLEDERQVIVESHASLSRPKENYPDVAAIVEDAEKGERVKVAISAKRLMALAQAICDVQSRNDFQVELSVHATDAGYRPILVKALNNETATGVIMPVYQSR